jgi:hypothetical protein
MPDAISGMKILVKKARERIAVDIGGLVDLLGHAAHEAFKDPDRQRHVEQAMGQRHGDVRVEQANRGVELEERQREHRRRRHPVGQQPEEQVLVAEEPVAREGVGRRQRHAIEITVLIRRRSAS